jgi:cardiolipin synthase
LLETYIFSNDVIGKRFRDVLTKKASEGVKVKLLLDAWGSPVKKSFFSKFLKSGGELKKVREIRYVFNMFSANHERDHKKLLIIDEKITYIGSCNITRSCINWRELVLRIYGGFGSRFAKFFNYTWDNKKIKDNIQNILDGNFQILYDFPSNPKSIVENKYLELIIMLKKN